MHTNIRKSKVLFSLFLFFTLTISIPAIFAQTPALAQMDRLYKESKSKEEYDQIALQMEKFLENNPNLHEWKWRLARVHYAIAKNFEGSRVHHYEQCILLSSQAIELQSNSAISYFYRGLCRGKKGELKGVWASLGIIDPFAEDMKKAVSLAPTVNHSGPHRALGKLYLELPFFLGGDLDKSEFHFLESIRYAPDFAENHLGLAQVLMKKNKSKKALETHHKLMQLTDNTQDEKLLSLRKDGLELLEELSP